MSVNTGIHMDELPKTAKTRNTALMLKANTMFWTGTPRVRLDSSMTSGMRRRSSFMLVCPNLTSPALAKSPWCHFFRQTFEYFITHYYLKIC